MRAIIEQALHIFRKDVRALRLPIALVLALAALHEITPMRAPGHDSLSASFGALLVLGWWYLIAAVVQSDSLVGDRQFWVTRPYRWQSLFAAKVLFIALFVEVPLAVTDCAILSASGFAPWNFVGNLAWKHVATLVLLIAPVFAVAAVTRTVRQTAMWLFVAMLAILARASLHVEVKSLWIVTFVFGAMLLVTALAVLHLQYRNRATSQARWVMTTGAVVAFICANLLPWSVVLAVEDGTRPTPPELHDFAIRVEPGRAVVPPDESERWTGARFDVPVAFDHLPEGAFMIARDGRVRFTAGAEMWESNWNDLAILGPRSMPEHFSFLIPENVAARFERRPIHLTGEVALTIFGGAQTSELTGKMDRQAVAGGGFCVAYEYAQSDNFECRYPIRLPSRFTWLRPGGPYSINSHEKILPFALTPVARFTASIPWSSEQDAPTPPASIRAERVLANLRRQFEADIPRLDAYRVREPRRSIQ